jgi:intracellular protein transport protein USO1
MKERETLSARAATAEAAQAELKTLRSQVEEAETKAKSVQGELDDLLLVLGEMEDKASRYKDKIKSLGGEITDEEDEEDDE